MWVYQCFDGDDDMALAWAQHDLYFVSEERPDVHIDRYSTLGWLWANVINSAWTRGHPWLDRNLERLKRIQREGFSHKLLQDPHEHMAAYFRWARQTKIKRNRKDCETYPLELVEEWKTFLRKEIPDLLSSNEALVSLAKSMVYQCFDEGEQAYRDFQDVLMRRYGFECVERTTWWSLAVAERVRLAAYRSRGTGADDQHGCDECWPVSADAAWEAGPKLHCRETLIEESHFRALVATCSKCGQPYLRVFTELIDWKDGDDSQSWSVVPLTAAEAHELLEIDAKGGDSDVYSIGEERRSLWRVSPRGSTAANSWGLGVAPLPHD